MNPFILCPGWQIRFFPLGTATDYGERKVWLQTCWTSQKYNDFVLHPARDVGVDRFIHLIECMSVCVRVCVCAYAHLHRMLFVCVSVYQEIFILLSLTITYLGLASRFDYFFYSFLSFFFSTLHFLRNSDSSIFIQEIQTVLSFSIPLLFTCFLFPSKHPNSTSPNTPTTTS